MNLIVILRVYLVSVFALCCAQVQAKPAPQAYGELPAISTPVLSPSGARMAATITFEGQREIAVFDQTLHPLKRVDIDQLKIRSMDFVTDDLLLVQRSTTENLGFGFAQDKFEFYQALLLPLSSPDSSLVFGDRAELIKAVFGFYGIRKVDGHPKAYFGAIELKRQTFGGNYSFDHGRPALYEVDLLTNRSRKIDSSPPEGFLRDWLVADNGKVLVQLNVNKSSGDWLIRNARGMAIAKGSDSGGRVGLVAIGDDGASVIYSSVDHESGEAKWYKLPVDGSGMPEEFLPGIDVQRLYIDRENGRLIGYLKDAGDQQPVFYDPALSAKAKMIRKAFPKLNVRMVDWTQKFDRVLVNTNGNGDSGSFYLVDLASHKADPIGYEYPAIEPADVGPISTVAYTASDGLEMDGILTLPPGKEAKNLPLVMLPHGGPHSYDVAGFDWWAQAFASQGYAVFQPNFRGSTNRGAAFSRAGDGQWGRKMQTDISDGLAKLVADGLVDPRRVCIVGASYGGYAALAGVTLQSGLYRCAVSVAGVADVSLMSRIEQREDGDSRILARSLETELGPKSGYRDISPRYHAANADAPILLIHGRDDTVVNFNQSEKMADALKDAGKPFEFVALDGEDHWLSQPATREAMLKASLAFVEKFNPAQQ